MSFSDCPSENRFCINDNKGISLQLSKIQTSKSWIELVENCNLNCIHCNVESNSKENNKFDYEIFKKILIPLYKRLSIKELYISGGEPLLHQDFIKFLTSASNNNIKTTILTNGLLLNDTNIIKLKELKHKLQISLDGYDKETYEYVRGKNTFSPIKNNMKKLIERGLEKQIIIQTVIMNHNVNNLHEFINFCLERKIPKIIFTPIQKLGAVNKNEIWNKVKVELEIRLKVFNWIKHVRNQLKNRLEIVLSGMILQPDEFEKLQLKKPEITCEMCCEELQISVNGSIILCPRFDSVRKNLNLPRVEITDFLNALRQNIFRLEAN